MTIQSPQTSGKLVGWMLALGLLTTALRCEAATVDEVFGPGWQCPLMTNTLYRPGVIFEVNAASAKRFVADLTSLPSYSEKVASAAVGRFTSKRSVDTEVFVSLLGKLLRGINSTIGAGLGSSTSTEVEFEVDKYVVTPAEVVPLALSHLRTIQPNSNSRYYLVREAVSVKSMSYETGDAVAAKLGIEADVKKMARASVDVQGTGNSSYSLKAIFPQPMWACHTADRLLPQSNIVGTVTWEKRAEPPPATDRDDLEQQ